MEIFVKVIAEDLKTGKCRMAATAFLTFVGLDENKRPARVPDVIPETEEEKRLNETHLSGQAFEEKGKKKAKNGSSLFQQPFLYNLSTSTIQKLDGACALKPKIPC